MSRAIKGSLELWDKCLDVLVSPSWKPWKTRLFDTCFCLDNTNLRFVAEHAKDRSVAGHSAQQPVAQKPQVAEQEAAHEEMELA
jgi:hypothetical protein